MADRYNTKGNSEGEYQPGSNELVLRNLPGITNSHLEFIIIHPFRDGNGRLGRLLCTVMALQAGMPILNFELLEKDTNRYIKAIHAGHAGNYEPMRAIFSEILTWSLQQGEQI